MDGPANNSNKSAEPATHRRPRLSVIRKTAVGSGLAVACLALYVLWFVHGRPDPAVDYLALLNETNRPKELSSEDNAWPLYRQAIELLVDPDAPDLHESIFDYRGRRFSELAPAEQTAVAAWVERNRDAWRQFVAASRKPRYHRPCRPVSAPDELLAGLDVPTVNIDMTHLESFQTLRALAIWHSRIEATCGRVQDGFDDALAIVRAGRHLDRSKLLVEMLSGLALCSAGHTQILEIASTHKFFPAEVERFRNELRNAFGTDYPTLDLDGERIVFRDIVQHIFTKGGIGGGHLIPRYLPPLIRTHSVIKTLGELDTETNAGQMAFYTAIALVHTRRSETMRRYRALCDRAEAIAGMTPFRRKRDNISLGVKRPHIFNFHVHLDSFAAQSRDFVATARLPAVERMSDILHQTRTLHEATATVLALIAYRLDTGDYPDDLPQLLRAGYLDQLPQDPFSDRPLVYRKIDGDFTLYSVGRNFTDQGGQTASAGGKHRPVIWGTDADAVFWPAPYQSAGN